MTRWIVGTILISLLFAAACVEGGGPPEGLESIVGDCQTGTTLQVAEGCTIAHTDAEDYLWVPEEGFVCYHVKQGGILSSTTNDCSNVSLSNDAITATENEDGSWTVEGLP